MAQSQVLPKVHIHGATAALMLHSTALATQDCDGLLFGGSRRPDGLHPRGPGLM